MTPDEFIAKWRQVELKERTASQSHFNDLCRLLGQPDPVVGHASVDHGAEEYVRGDVTTYIVGDTSPLSGAA
jgi:hypothetical protein